MRHRRGIRVRQCVYGARQCRVLPWRCALRSGGSAAGHREVHAARKDQAKRNGQCPSPYCAYRNGIRRYEEPPRDGGSRQGITIDRATTSLIQVGANRRKLRWLAAQRDCSTVFNLTQLQERYDALTSIFFRDSACLKASTG